jgi:hypothetical protein
MLKKNISRTSPAKSKEAKVKPRPDTEFGRDLIDAAETILAHQRGEITGSCLGRST